MIQPYTKSEKTVRTRTPKSVAPAEPRGGVTGMGDLKRNPEPETERQCRDQRDPSACLEHARDDIRLGNAGLRRFDPKGKQKRDQQGNGHHRWFEPAGSSPLDKGLNSAARHSTAGIPA